ncbi:hypothetical protein [Peribacillus asahii]|uniref:hypothetical protein n=1 Tax=Peribacillus asahii TaxID=228899 RepID=UPI00207A543A|nr:hypothetical protein [Peribacillus asahii]USK62358.1 hypothetical protein LIT37_22945 [Peribacillus asahii]
MLKEKEIRILIPNKEAHSNNRIQPCKYLIQNVENSKYMIHRELKEGELRYYHIDNIMEYKGAYYLYCIEAASTEEQAKSIIKSYWDNVKKINSVDKTMKKLYLKGHKGTLKYLLS